MRKIAFVAILIALSGVVFGQRGKKDQTTEARSATSEFKIQRTVYHNALQYNDPEVAIHALHNMIALRPEDAGLKDSLAYLYFNAGAYVQTILLGKEIMEQKPDNKEVLELVAVSEQNLGAQKEALEHYEQLYQLTQSPFHLYQIASLQYSLKRYGECEMSVNRILADPAAGEEMVGITIGKGQTQKVPLKAAAYNMKGVIAMDLSKNDIAKNNFEEALEIFPEFQLASLNLKSLTEGESGEMTDKEEAKD